MPWTCTGGKSAVRLNALRYGLRARSILLPGENPEEYHQLCADLEADWQPQNRTEQLLLEQMAVAQWKLARIKVGERAAAGATFFQGRPRSGALPARLWPPPPAARGSLTSRKIFDNLAKQ